MSIKKYYFIAMEYGTARDKGTRAYMEDRNREENDLLSLGDKTNDSNTKWSFFGVFDGHGGDICSTFVSKHLPESIAAQETFPDDIEKSLDSAFKQTDKKFFEANPKLLDDGSTVVCSIVKVVDSVPKTIWVANSGDSRALLIKLVDNEFKAKALSEDHKPGLASEKARIEANKGSVRPTSIFGIKGPDRVYDSKNRGGLAVARGAGDQLMKRDNLVIVDPDVVKYEIKENTVGIVLASDGLYDVFSNDKVATIIGTLLQENNSPQEIATKLTTKSVKESVGGCDNVAVVFVQFKNPFLE